MYRPCGRHCLLLPMVSSLYYLYVCSVIVTFICIKKTFERTLGSMKHPGKFFEHCSIKSGTYLSKRYLNFSRKLEEVQNC